MSEITPPEGLCEESEAATALGKVASGHRCPRARVQALVFQPLQIPGQTWAQDDGALSREPQRQAQRQEQRLGSTWKWISEAEVPTI